MHLRIAFAFLALGRAGCLSDRRIGDGALAQRQLGELTVRVYLVQRFLHRRMAEGKPALQQVDAQHGFRWVRRTTTSSLGVERLNQLQQPYPWSRSKSAGAEVSQKCTATSDHPQWGSGLSAYAPSLFGKRYLKVCPLILVIRFRRFLSTK